jgi:hypothetical protein
LWCRKQELPEKSAGRGSWVGELGPLEFLDLLDFADLGLELDFRAGFFLDFFLPGASLIFLRFGFGFNGSFGGLGKEFNFEKGGGLV